MLSWAASSALDIRILQRQSECCAGPPAQHSTFDLNKNKPECWDGPPALQSTLDLNKNKPECWDGPPGLHSTLDLNNYKQECWMHSTFDFYIDNLNVVLGRQLSTRHSIFTKTIWMLCWAASSALNIRFLHRQSECWAELLAQHSTFDFYLDDLNVELSC